MPIETDEDLDLLLSDFNELIYFEEGKTDPNATGIHIMGIFEDESDDPVRGHSEIEALKPSMTVKKSDVPDLSNKDVFNLVETDTNYEVVKPLSDGTGLIDVLLKEQI